MAVTAIQYLIVRDLYEQGLLPKGGALLEIGEANWYGDANPLDMIADIERFVEDAERRQSLSVRVREAMEKRPDTFAFDIVKVFYELFFAPSEVRAIDLEGTLSALRLDLNQPIDLGRQFAVVINHGTAEHIFNIAQVFRTIHDHTAPGGLMLHESPFTGWVDHGFYNLQPTLFFDLAQHNRYAVRRMYVEDNAGGVIRRIAAREELYELAKQKQLPANSLLFTVLAKPEDERPFELPLQGYYRKALPQAGMEAWRDLR